MSIKVLAVGDTVGAAGIEALEKKLRFLKQSLDIAFTVANGENASGFGITPEQANRLLDAGVDVITLGNHAWDRRDIRGYLDDNMRILRPANYAARTPGRGWYTYDAPFGGVCVMNVMGRYGMKFGGESPFFEADRIIERAVSDGVRVILVDFHAEATSEKLAMAYYLDGRVSALWGTHTHVQTSDVTVFPNGMGYITDLGMTGAAQSVIGVKPERSISAFLGDPTVRMETAYGKAKIECAVFEIDAATGRCLSAEALRIL